MSTFKLQTAFALALMAGVLPMANAARAADLDPGYADVPAPIPQQMVTFGSGWYIRGDLGGTRANKISPSSPSFDTTDPTSIPIAPNLDVSQSAKYGYTASLGAGYKFNNWFRADTIVDFHQPISALVDGSALKCPGGYIAQGDGTYRQGLEGCQPHYKAKLNSFDVLVNGYIDLGTYSIVTPYVGAGVGLAFGHYSTSATYTQTDGTPYDIDVTDPGTGASYHLDYDTAASGTYYNFAYALMAGVAVDVYDHTKLDIGYRYLNQGSIKGVTNGPIYSHEIRAGLRYMIDN